MGCGRGGFGRDGGGGSCGGQAVGLNRPMRHAPEME